MIMIADVCWTTTNVRCLLLLPRLELDFVMKFLLEMDCCGYVHLIVELSLFIFIFIFILVQVREFCLAEIEHFVHPDEKEKHILFKNVKDKVVCLFSSENQLGIYTSV